MSDCQEWSRLLKLTVLAAVTSCSITYQIKSSLSFEWRDDRYTGIAQDGYCLSSSGDYHVQRDEVISGSSASIYLPLVFISKDSQTRTACFEISNLTQFASALRSALFDDGAIDKLVAQFIDTRELYLYNLWIIVLSLASIFLDILFERKRITMFENPNQATFIRRLNSLICFSIAGLLITSGYSSTNLTVMDCSKLLESSLADVKIKEITAFCNILSDSNAVVMSVFNPLDTFIQNYGKVLYFLSILLVFSVLFQELIKEIGQRCIARVIQPLDIASEFLDLEGLQARTASEADGTLSLLEELRAAATLAVENREDGAGRGREAKNCKTIPASSVPDENIARGNCSICLTSLFMRRWHSNMHGDSIYRDEITSYLDGNQGYSDDVGSLLLFDASFSTLSHSSKDTIRSRRTPSNRRHYRSNIVNIPDLVPPMFPAVQSDPELVEICRNGQNSNSDPNGGSKINSFETTNTATPRATPSETTVVEAPCGHLFHKSCLREWTAHRSTCPVCRSELLAVSVDVAT